MRVPGILFALAMSAPAVAAAPTSITAKKPPPANCPKTTSYVASDTGIYRGKPLTPRKLIELPPGIPYMAVYRRIDGCEAPMTMVEYRNPRGR